MNQESYVMGQNDPVKLTRQECLLPNFHPLLIQASKNENLKGLWTMEAVTSAVARHH